MTQIPPQDPRNGPQANAPDSPRRASGDETPAPSPRALISWTRLVATFFGAGLLRPAPGTWGSLAALPVAWALHVLGGFWMLAAATVAVAALGWWVTRFETRGSADPDPSEIVIDEVAGMWLALWPVSLGAMIQGIAVTALWPGWVVAFVAFRVLDIWKPTPVRWADRLHGPAGVVLDDLIAGALAALVVVFAGGIFHGVLMR